MSAGGFFDKLDEIRTREKLLQYAFMLVIAPDACVILENGKSP
jgi:hypothetical protein